jgi:hypothetical protein
MEKANALIFVAIKKIQEN